MAANCSQVTAPSLTQEGQMKWTVRSAAAGELSVLADRLEQR